MDIPLLVWGFHTTVARQAVGDTDSCTMKSAFQNTLVSEAHSELPLLWHAEWIAELITQETSSNVKLLWRWSVIHCAVSGSFNSFLPRRVERWRHVLYIYLGQARLSFHPSDIQVWLMKDITILNYRTAHSKYRPVAVEVTGVTVFVQWNYMSCFHIEAKVE